MVGGLDKGVHTFPKDINPKGNNQFELTTTMSQPNILATMLRFGLCSISYNDSHYTTYSSYYMHYSLQQKHISG